MNQTINFNFKLIYLRNNLTNVNEELVKAIDLLNSMENPSRIFDENSSNYRAFIFLGKVIHNFEKKTNFDLFFSTHFEIFLSNLLLYLYEINNELNFLIVTDLINAEEALSLNEKRILIFSFLLYMANIIVNNSREFCIEFLKKNGLKAYFKFIQDEKFIERNKSTKIKDLTKNPLNLFDCIILNISTMCTRTCDDFKKLWIDLDSINVLLKISKLQESCSFDALMIITWIVNDLEIDQNLAEMNAIVEKIMKFILKCANDFTMKLFKRLKYQVNFKGKILTCLIQSVEYKNSTYVSVVELINCIYKLSVNQNIKKYIYFKHEITNYIKIFFSKGNLFEINYALDVLAQLSIDITIKSDLIKNKELIILMNSLPKRILNEIDSANNDEMEIFKNIQSLIEQINWNMRNKVTFLKNEYLILSHEVKSTEFCLKLKEKLEIIGYKVQITESDFNSSIKAIEKCSCFIMCVDERYRQSVIGQNQAQHAVNLNKKIISLILQEGYENVKGWLGLIINKGISIDFTKDVDESFRKLENELKSNLEEPNDYYYFFPLKTSLSISEYNEIDEWNEDKAKEWFDTNNLSLFIYDYLKPCNGKSLKQLFKIKLNCPEFYYNILKDVPNINFNSIILFSTFLDELFDINKLKL